jgi:hypothetical protein
MHRYLCEAFSFQIASKQGDVPAFGADSNKMMATAFTKRLRAD